MFGIGGTEFILILVFGFLIFGPDKLPAIAKTVMQALNKFKSAQEEMSKVIKTEVYDPNSDEPFKNPLEALSKVSGADKKAEKKESFTERKAKYDKERAAQKAAEETKETAGSSTDKDDTKKADAPASEKEPASKRAEDASDAPKPVSKAKPNVDELYGNKPVRKTSTAKSSSGTKATDSASSTKANTSTSSTTEKGE